MENDPLWYKDAILYELNLRAFLDSNGDGIGDFRGLTQKLDYLQDLGVTALWLLPFFPSPLRDDGYDIADHTDVHPAYGTLRDFRTFVREAHRRGLRVVTELMINHTSDQHPWFQRARRAPPGSRWRNFYVWSPVPDRYREARIIFKDFEASNWTWDPIAQAYYWHRFYWHQPDLNFDSADVRRAVLRVVDFWLRRGVDGMRLDAIPYLYEREGTSSENLPETHTFLRELRRHVDARYGNHLLLAEANQWPEDAVAYFGEGDECHMAFHFPLMPRLFMAVRMEDRFPIVDILRQTPPIPPTGQWALFLRNHDELTLETVTDEDRDYMYRIYAQDPEARINLGIRRRLAPLLGNHRRKMELMNGLLFSLPGTPVLYYGDEIGMGDNVHLGDRNGVRTPMQWSPDRNAGFSEADPEKLYLPVIVDPEYHYQSLNVEAQQKNPHSLLWWTKRLIALRKRYRAFSRGTLELLHPANPKVLAFLRRYRGEDCLVVANLSRFAQAVELDLASWHGRVPVEIFGRTSFPPIGERPYLLTLGPHSFYWFSLEGQRIERPLAAEIGGRMPALEVSGPAEGLFEGPARRSLEALLPSYLRPRRWFAGRGRTIQAARLQDVVAIPRAPGAVAAHLVLVRVEYAEGEAEVYALPVALAAGQQADRALRQFPQAIIARLQGAGGKEGDLLYDALADAEISRLLLDAIAGRQRFEGPGGEVLGAPSPALRHLMGDQDEGLAPSPIEAEQANTSIGYGGRLILKVFRRLDEGVNPELEMGRFLTEQAGFSHTPVIGGFLEYRREGAEPVTLGVLQQFVPNQGDAWQYTLDELARYFERVLAGQARAQPPVLDWAPLDLLEGDPPVLWRETIGAYLEYARLLGQRTAELHTALGSSSSDPSFAPEPFSLFYQRSLYQSLRALSSQVFGLLRRRLAALPADTRSEAELLLAVENSVLDRFRPIVDQPLDAVRIRCHGALGLSEVLQAGGDFCFIDFEGDRTRPLSERRLKRSPLRDVADMLWSFHWAAHAALRGGSASMVRSEDVPVLEPWTRFWHLGASAAFLQGYLPVGRAAGLVPEHRQQLEVLLEAHLLERALHQLGSELNERPQWARVPLVGILGLLGA